MIEPAALLATVVTKFLEAGVQILIDPVQELNRKVRRKSALKGNNDPSIRFDIEAMPRLVAEHLDEVRQWASTTSIKKFSGKDKSVASVYVSLGMFLIPERDLEPDEPMPPQEDAISLLSNTTSHIIIVGQPGCGKTTLLRQICLDFFRKGTALKRFSFPLVVRLRDIRSDSLTPLFDHLTSLFPIEILSAANGRTFTTDSSRKSLIARKYFQLFDRVGIALLLDGFDEIPSQQTRSHVLKDIEAMAKTFRESRIVLTSRTGLRLPSPHGVQKYQVAPLTYQQIDEFAAKWLGDKEKGEVFIGQLKGRPFYSATLRPLLLAYLCTLFDRYRKIPERAARVYDIIVGIFLNDWDEQNDVIRQSEYANFSPPEKFAFLCQLAFELTTKLQTFEFDSRSLERAYLGIYANFSLPKHQSKEVAMEIESHTGLFIETRSGKYEFFHRSIQEYLAAEYIGRLPSIDHIFRFLHLLPTELAVATGLSSSPAAYFAYFVLSRSGHGEMFPEDYFETYAIRLAEEQPVFGPEPIAILALFALIPFCESAESQYAIDRLALQIGAQNDTRYIQSYYSSQPDLESTDAANLFSRKWKLKRPHEVYQLPEYVRTTSKVLAAFAN